MYIEEQRSKKYFQKMVKDENLNDKDDTDKYLTLEGLYKKFFGALNIESKALKTKEIVK